MMIKTTDYAELCDFIFDGDNPSFPDSSGLVYVPLDRIVEFFHYCWDSPHSFIVISGRSDYSLSYNKEYPPFLDMAKWVNFIDWQNEVQGYEDITLKARCYKHNCKITDKYSLRFYSFTGFTFDKIPPNIKAWYSTNCNIDEATPIPFGVPDWFVDNFNEKKLKPWNERTIDFYVNFQNNTLERVNIKKLASNIKTDAKIVVEPDTLNHLDYVETLGNCKYVICTEGNGLDCYRTLEAIYSGCIPLIIVHQPSRWVKCYDLPVFPDLITALNNCIFPINPINPKYTLDYWKNKFEKEKENVR